MTRNNLFALALTGILFISASPALVLAQAMESIEPFKVGTFAINNVPTVGLVLRDDQLIVDLSAANRALQLLPEYSHIAMPDDMLGLIEQYEYGLKYRIYELVNWLSVQADKWEIEQEIRLDSTQTKGSKAQTVVLNNRLRAEIAEYLGKRPRLRQNPNSPLLTSQKRGGFNSQTIQNLFRALYQATGIKNASSHSGRRTFITGLSEKGVSVRVIQELARHSSMATTQRYIDVSVDKLRSAVELATL